jgi:acetyl esterase/lipase
MAGVPVALVTPAQQSPYAAGRVLINVHSGAFIRGKEMSPLFADLEGFPPTLLMTETRDFFLSSTAACRRPCMRSFG